MGMVCRPGTAPVQPYASWRASEDWPPRRRKGVNPPAHNAVLNRKSYYGQSGLDNDIRLCSRIVYGAGLSASGHIYHTHPRHGRHRYAYVPFHVSGERLLYSAGIHARQLAAGDNQPHNGHMQCHRLRHQDSQRLLPQRMTRFIWRCLDCSGHYGLLLCGFGIGVSGLADEWESVDSQTIGNAGGQQSAGGFAWLDMND